MNLSRLAPVADSIEVCSPFDGRVIGAVPRLEAGAVPYLLQQAREGVQAFSEKRSPTFSDR